MKGKVGCVVTLGTLLASSVYAPGANAHFFDELCFSNDVFGDRFAIGVTGETTVGRTRLLSLSNRRFTFAERGVYGAITMRDDECLFSQEYHFPNGSIAHFCDLPPGCVGTGPGQLTQSFNGETPVVNPVTCTFASCNVPTALMSDVGGSDPEH